MKQNELTGPPVKDFAQGWHGPIGIWLVEERAKVQPAQQMIYSLCRRAGQDGLCFASGPVVIGDTLLWMVKTEIREFRPWSDD